MVKLYIPALVKKILLICFGLTGIIVHGQPLFNGTWEGNYGKQFFLDLSNPSRLVIDLNIEQDSIITGSSHLYYRNRKYEHHRIDGKLNPKDSTVQFREGLIETNLGMGVYEVAYKMKLVDAGDKWKLEGRWKAAKGSVFGYAWFNSVWLYKQKEKKGTADSVKHPPLQPIASPIYDKSPALNRISDLQSLVEIPRKEKDSIQLAIYDNGEIDQDSVSLYFNDQLLVNRQGLSGTPLLYSISLEGTGNIHKIKMIAENLGSIPPNTALLVITTKSKRHEVRMSSDLHKNAVVELFVVD